MGFPRGTTPTLKLKLPEKFDLELAKSVYATFTLVNGEAIIKDSIDGSVTVEKNIAQVTLTQEETFKMVLGKIKVQLNWMYDDGKRWATKVKTVDVTEQLLKEILD
jgi:hypothetical protein